MEFIAVCFFATWILLIITFAVVRSFDEVEARKIKEIYNAISTTEKFFKEYVGAEKEKTTSKLQEIEHSLSLKFEFLKKEIEDTAKVVDEAKRMMNNTKIANNLVTRVRKDTHGA